MGERERVICKLEQAKFGPHTDGGNYRVYAPDPSAPSLREVVEELRFARHEYDAMLGHANRPTEGEIPDRIKRLDALIARLEGE